MKSRTRTWIFTVFLVLLVTTSFMNRVHAQEVEAGLRREALSTEAKAFYDLLRPCITEVASGERTSTVFTVNRESHMNEYDIYSLIVALMFDCPYEMFWFDTLSGYNIDVEDTGQTSFFFYVSPEYAAGEFQTNPDAIATALAAKERADQIIAAYADVSDYEKLMGYKNEICNLVSYNTWASENENIADRNAWQMIWVFDDDPSTNVVCEGYAKAFKYLCDHTAFETEIHCFCVTGTLENDITHMWNLVSMPNGKVYLTDITNCDEGMAGEGDELFLVGYYNQNADNEYVIRCIQGDNSTTVKYTYDQDTVTVYDRSELTISEYSYVEEASGSIEERETSQLKYRVVNREVIITGYCDIGNGELEIPSEIEGIPVAEIGKEAFTWCLDLTKIKIPGSVKRIRSGAFYGCNNLEDVELSEGLISIDTYAFTATNIEYIEFPSTLTEIGTWAFSSGSLKAIIIPGNIKTIEDMTFAYCRSLSSVVLEPGIKEIGAGAFSCCSNIPEIVIPDGVDIIGREAFADCSSLRSINIPDSVTEIGDYALRGCSSLENITISDNSPICKTIDGVMFSKDGTLLYCYPAARPQSEYAIPDGVKSIAMYAFCDCNLLTDVSFPDSVTEIQSYAFYKCMKLTNIRLPKYFSSGGWFSLNTLFSECGKLENIFIDNDNQEYRTIDGVLFNKEMTQLLVYPAGKREKSYTIPNGVTDIAGEAFRYCTNLEEVIVPQGVKSIGYYAFSDCTALKEIELAESISTIGAYAFMNCANLTCVNIPQGVHEIKEDTFVFCSRLQQVTIPNGITSIGEAAFLECSDLEEINLPDTITYIGNGAFRGCSSLKDLILPRALTSIGNNVFERCGFTSIIIPEGVTEIGFQAFAWARLRQLYLPKSIQTIGDSAFDGCPLTVIYYPGTQEEWSNISVGMYNTEFREASVQNLNGGWGEVMYFWSVDRSTVTAKRIDYSNPGMYEEESVVVTAQIISPTETETGEAVYTSAPFENPAFSSQSMTLYIPALNEMDVLYLPAGINRIESEAFAEVNCRAVIIPDGCKAIEDDAFAGCLNLVYISVPEDIESLSLHAFDGCNGVVVDYR